MSTRTAPAVPEETTRTALDEPVGLASSHRVSDAELPDDTPVDAGPELAVPHECEAPEEALKAPPRASSRSRGVDAVRGVAVLGMMVVHLLSPTIGDAEPNPVWVISAGHASVIFALLAGFGVAVTTRRRDTPVQTAAALIGRALAIFVLGLVLVVASHNRALVILPQYGLLFLLAVPLLGLSWRALAALAAVLAVVTPAAHVMLRDQAVEVAGVNPHVSWVLHEPRLLAQTLLITGGYPVLVWVTFLVAGMAVGRSPYQRRRAMLGILGIGAVLAVGTWVITHLLLGPFGGMSRLTRIAEATGGPDPEEMLVWGSEGTLPTTSWWWQAVPGPHTSTWADVAFSLGLALALLGLFMILGSVTAKPLAPLTVLGSMPLTAYALHLIFMGDPWAAPTGTLDLFGQLALIVLVILFWRRVDRRGPLEEVVRSVGVLFATVAGLVVHLVRPRPRGRHARA